MTLYELMKVAKEDYDTYDDVYDAVVTVCYIDEEDVEDNYDKFCTEIIKKVEVEEKVGDGFIVKWTELIEKNMEKFRKFTKENWKKDCQYEDDDEEFVYQWINEIHSYMAGYVPEDFYKELVAFVETLN